MAKELYFGPIRNVKFVGNNAAKKFQSRRECYICGQKFDYQIEYKYTGKISTKKNKRHVTYTNEDKTVFMTEDHVIPKSILKKCGIKGFKNNLEPCCNRCNHEKGRDELNNYYKSVDKIFSSWIN